jgi:hypothetical protein
MKKLLFILIIFLIALPGAFANDDYRRPPMSRAFEIGFNAGFNVSNDFLSIGDIFQRTFTIDFDELANGLRFNLGVNAAPFYFSINAGSWGFGLSTNIEAAGILSLSGDMITFSEANNSISEASGAVFASAGIDTFFHIDRFRIRFRPAVYYTAMYMKPNISYTFDNTNNGTIFNINYDVRLYTPLSMEDFNNTGNFDLTATPGFDFSIGLEYPLSRAIGISNILPFLDIDIGVDFINIPIIASTMNNYMRIVGSIGSENPTNIMDDLDNFLSSFNDLDPEMIDGTETITIERPFKMLAWANWRPLLGSNLLTLTPVVGFAINPLYVEPFSFEMGINARLSLINILVATAGVNYTDRMWVNSLDLALNLRAIELNLGIDLRSQAFIGSWTAAGVGVNLGLKLGW